MDTRRADQLAVPHCREGDAPEKGGEIDGSRLSGEAPIEPRNVDDPRATLDSTAGSSVNYQQRNPSPAALFSEKTTPLFPLRANPKIAPLPPEAHSGNLGHGVDRESAR